MKLFSQVRRGLVFAAVALAAGSFGVQAVAADAAKKADEKGPLTVNLTLKRIVQNAQGEETLVDAPEVRPGDLLEYRAVYANVGDKTLNNVLATLPVPEGAQYQARTARPAPVLASTTGAEFAVEPLTRKARAADGKDAVENIPYAEYRALRWRISAVEPGKSVVVSARMRVAGPTPVTSPAAPAAEKAASARTGGS